MAHSVRNCYTSIQQSLFPSLKGPEKQTKPTRQTHFQGLKRNVSEGKGINSLRGEGDGSSSLISLWNVEFKGVNGLQSTGEIAFGVDIAERDFSSPVWIRRAAVARCLLRLLPDFVQPGPLGKMLFEYHSTVFISANRTKNSPRRDPDKSSSSSSDALHPTPALLVPAGWCDEVSRATLCHRSHCLTLLRHFIYCLT